MVKEKTADAHPRWLKSTTDRDLPLCAPVFTALAQPRLISRQIRHITIQDQAADDTKSGTADRVISDCCSRVENSCRSLADTIPTDAGQNRLRTAPVSRAIIARDEPAWAISFHVMFPAASIGLVCFIAELEGAWLRTGKAHLSGNKAVPAITMTFAAGCALISTMPGLPDGRHTAGRDRPLK